MAATAGGGSAGADTLVPVTVANAGVQKPATGTATMTFTIRLLHPATNTVKVNWTTSDGTAVAGRDYVAASGQASIAPGSTSTTEAVTILSNQLITSNRYFNFVLQGALNGTVENGSATGTIVDDTPAPLITVGDTATTLSYNATGSLSFTVSLSQASANVVTVRYRTSDGNLVAGLQYTAENGTLSFAPGVINQVVSVPLLGHVTAEQSWYLQLTLSAATNATIQSSTAYGYVTNNDRTAYAVVDDTTVIKPTSGTSTVSVPVRLLTASTIPMSFDYYTTDNTATAGTDYVTTRGTVTFPAGTTTATAAVTIDGSATTNAPRLFALNLNNPTAGGSVIKAGYVTIESPGVQPSELAIQYAGLLKPTTGTGTMTFTVTAKPAPSSTLTFHYATQDGSAVAGTDYTATTGIGTIAAGATSTTITVPILGNQLPKGDPNFYLTISGTTGGAIVDSQAEGVIESGAASQQASWLSVNPTSAVKPATAEGTMGFVVTLSPASGSPVTVSYATSDSTAVAGTDYTATTGTLTFAPGVTAQTVSVPIAPGTTPGSDKQFGLSISSATNGRIDTATNYGIIRNENYPPVLSIGDASTYRSASSTGAITFPVFLSAASVNPVTVAYSTSNGSAISGVDYTSASGTVSFPPGATRENITVSVPPLATYEAQVYFNLSLTSPVNALLSTSTAYGYVISNAITPVVSVSDTAVVASSAATHAVFTIGLGAPSATVVKVNYATSDGNALAGTDYTATTGTATFAAGVTSATVSVPVAANTVATGSRYFYLSISTPVNAFVGRNTATATILYGNVTPQLSVGDAIVTRQASGAKNATFTVTLTPASTATVTATYATSAGNATPGIDYTSVSGTVTFAPGTTSQTVSVPITAIATSTPDRYFSLSLGTPTNAALLRGYAYGEIVDTVAPTSGQSYVTVSDSTVVAPATGTATASFTVSLLPAAASTVTMSYATADSSALAGRDYTATRGTLTFAPGQTSKTVTVPVLAKNYAVGSRSFTLSVSQFSGPVSVLRSSGTGQILDPQPGGVITIGPDQSIVRGDSGSQTQTFTVSLVPAQSVAVNVDYQTADGSAVAGRDYAPVSGTLTFAPGQTSQTVSVTVFGNSTAFATQSYTLTLSSPTYVGIASYSSSATGYLDSSDTWTISGTVTSPSGTPLSGVTVTRTGNNQPAYAVTSGANGTYTIPDAVRGTYTVTPSGSGLGYLPASTSVSVGSANVTGVSLIGYSGVVVGGRVVTEPSGSALSGATVTRAGNGQANATATSNALGYWVIATPVSGSYTLTSAAAGYAGSSPSSYSVAVSGTSLTGEGFIELKAPFIAVRIVTGSGAAVTNASVAVSGPQSASTTLNVNGNYGFSGLVAGTYTVTATLAGHTFVTSTPSVTISATTGASVIFAEI